MNKIGFNQKHRTKRYYTFVQSVKKTVIYTAPFVIGLSLIYILFNISQDRAWIFLNGSPQNLIINNFEGRIDSKAAAISSRTRLRGVIVNQQSLKLSLNGEDFNLQPGDLQIMYGYSNENLNHWDNIISNTLLQFDMLDMKLSQLSITKNYFLQRFHDIPVNYSLSIDGNNSNEYFTATIYEKSFDLTVQGNVEVFINKKKYKSDIPYYEMKFRNPSDLQNSYFQFMYFDNIDLLIPSETGDLLFTGNAGGSKIFFKEGNLNFNQTINEKQFSLGGKQLIFSAVENEKVTVAYTAKNGSQIEVYGNVSEATLTGNKLFLSVYQWYIENISTVIGTIVATLLGIIIVKRK